MRLDVRTSRQPSNRHRLGFDAGDDDDVVDELDDVVKVELAGFDAVTGAAFAGAGFTGAATTAGFGAAGAVAVLGFTGAAGALA